MYPSMYPTAMRWSERRVSATIAGWCCVVCDHLLDQRVSTARVGVDSTAVAAMGLPGVMVFNIPVEGR